MAEGTRRTRGERRPAVTALRESWRRLNFEQRAAAVGALLLVVSTFGPFSFVEAAQVLVAVGVLYLLKQRADGRDFHLPFGDGTIVFAAGLWSALLIVVRLFDRPLGQGLLALACAGILVLAGVRERSKHPPDDVPPDVRPGPTLAKRRPVTRRRRSRTASAGPATPAGGDAAPAEATTILEAPTERLPGAEPVPEPEGPPEFVPPPDQRAPAAESPPSDDAAADPPPSAGETVPDEDVGKS